MGQRGPARRPTNLAILHGEKSNRINRNAPVASEGAPEPPYEFDPEVKAVWDHTVGQLRGMRTLSPADRDTLVAYCEAVVTHRRVTAELAAMGNRMMVAGAMGGQVKNPLVAMQRDAATLVRVLAREFGLTPSARSDITVGGAKGNPGAGPERFFS